MKDFISHSFHWRKKNLPLKCDMNTDSKLTNCKKHLLFCLVSILFNCLVTFTFVVSVVTFIDLFIFLDSKVKWWERLVGIHWSICKQSDVRWYGFHDFFIIIVCMFAVHWFTSYFWAKCLAILLRHLLSLPQSSYL